MGGRRSLPAAHLLPWMRERGPLICTRQVVGVEESHSMLDMHLAASTQKRAPHSLARGHLLCARLFVPSHLISVEVERHLWQQRCWITLSDIQLDTTSTQRIAQPSKGFQKATSLVRPCVSDIPFPRDH